MENFLFDYPNVVAGTGIPGSEMDIEKAMQAGAGTGQDYTDVLSSGGALKIESLDALLRVLTNREKQIVLYKMMPKQKAFSNVEQHLQLVDYGLNVGVSLAEGETPQFVDSIYTRKAAFVKYLGVSGEVTDVFTRVGLGGGVNDALAQEVYNKTQYLMRAINKKLPVDDSSMVANDFDGIFAQHYAQVGTSLDTYFGSSTLVNADGDALSDAMVEDAVNAVVNDNFGDVSDIIGAPAVFSNYVKRFHESKRVLVNNPLEATTGATMGQRVNTIATQFGDISIKNDIFFDYRKPKKYNEAATSAKAPNAPTAVSAVATADTNNKFGTKWAGNYWYAVVSKNHYGESTMTLLDTSVLAVAASESADLTWTQTDGAYASESFTVYRTEKGAASYLTADFYPIFSVNKVQHTAGYDGSGVAGVVRDRNRILPNTTSAIVLSNSIENWSIKELAPLMRMDLARTSPSHRFMILAYLTPILFQAKKIARIYNLGKNIE